MVDVTLEALGGLLGKYREIKRLRDQAASTPDVDPSRAMAALSARYPGALRELDRRTMPDIEARIAALEAARAGRQPVARWMELWIGYHGLLRVALAIKRKRSLGSAAIWRELHASYRPASDEPALSVLGAQAVEEILRPPGGRLNGWVFARIGDRHGLSASAVEAVLFAPLEETPSQ